MRASAPARASSLTLPRETPLVQVGADAGEAALRGSRVGVVEGDAVPGHRRHLGDPVPHDAGAEDGDAFDPACHAATRP